jgi:hypothetical protein
MLQTIVIAFVSALAALALTAPAETAGTIVPRARYCRSYGKRHRLQLFELCPVPGNRFWRSGRR